MTDELRNAVDTSVSQSVTVGYTPHEPATREMYEDVATRLENDKRVMVTLGDGFAPTFAPDSVAVRVKTEVDSFSRSPIRVGSNDVYYVGTEIELDGVPSGALDGITDGTPVAIHGADEKWWYTTLGLGAVRGIGTGDRRVNIELKTYEGPTREKPTNDRRYVEVGFDD